MRISKATKITSIYYKCTSVRAAFFHRYATFIKLFSVPLWLLFLLPPFTVAAQSTVSFDPTISIPSDSSRVYTYTNRLDAFWAGETNEYHSSAFHGLTYRKQPLFEDFYIFIDGDLLPRDRASAEITPLSLTRRYQDPGLTEKIYFPDERRILVVELISNRDYQITIVPAFANTQPEIESESEVLSLVQRSYTTPTGLPVKSFIEVSEKGRWVSAEDSLVESVPAVVPIQVARKWEGQLSDTLRIFYSFAHDSEVHDRQRRNWKEGLAARQTFINERLATSVTDNSRVNKALMWARFHMNSLIMNQSGRGIYAGLPWFDDYWGRDTFISFPGAVLVNGNYDAAKQILRSFAEFQITDTGDVNYGRIPNRVTPGEKVYNTTDGTPWFVWMIHEYLRYSGDISFAVEIYPVVKRSIEGALQNYVTDQYLLSHGDAETWMDAVGPDGPWSPRGNRAVEIQVLWFKQLQAGMALADLLDRNRDYSRWEEIAQRVRVSFDEKYWFSAEERLFDHLNASGSPDSSHRPNQMFAVSLDSLLTPDQGASVVESVVRNTVYPWGVASLTPSDPNFHPFHQIPGYYPKDAAYHNGIIWTWLSGPVISGLLKYGVIDKAYTLTDNLTDHILDRGTPGSIAEVKDALPRNLWKGSGSGIEPVCLSGTFSQAWSLAEYLRNWYQDYFGIHPDAFTNVITLSPQLPSGVSTVRTVVPIDESTVDIRYHRTSERFTIRLQVKGAPVGIQIRLRRGGQIYQLPQPFQLASTKDPVALTFDETTLTYSLDQIPLNTKTETSRFSRSLIDSPEFLEPYLPEELAALRGPDHPTLPGSVATAENPDARVTVERADPAGDDLGPNLRYAYPTDPHFEPGIFDITSFVVRYDAENVYFDLTFRNLVQPGWHPEYGFQLTYAAIGFHTGDGSGTLEFGANADYRVDAPDPMQYILYIGGGFRLVDSEGEILVEYIPTEMGYSMADLDRNTISIAIPKKYLPQPKRWWSYTVLTGGQDDHGGAGLGEFRTIREEAGPWHGGGKTDPDGPNWYDILTIGYE